MDILNRYSYSLDCTEKINHFSKNVNLALIEVSNYFNSNANELSVQKSALLSVYEEFVKSFIEKMGYGFKDFIFIKRILTKEIEFYH